MCNPLGDHEDIRVIEVIHDPDGEMSYWVCFKCGAEGYEERESRNV